MLQVLPLTKEVLSAAIASRKERLDLADVHVVAAGDCNVIDALQGKDMGYVRRRHTAQFTG